MTWLKTLTISAAVVLSALAIADRIDPMVDRICSFQVQP